MSAPVCVVCHALMTRHGKTSSGRQRWRCRSCQLTGVHRIEGDAKHLGEFLGWLFSRGRQGDWPGAGRSFRRRTQGLWNVWPLLGIVDEVHHVICVDGIHLGRRAVVLIARSDDYVLGVVPSQDGELQSVGGINVANCPARCCHHPWWIWL